MSEHDLSALDGLLDELDIDEKGDQDPRAAKLKALFEKAKAEYTAKIDVPTWYISPSTCSATFQISNFVVPSPLQLVCERKANRTGSTNQEWTVNYLYSQGHFETCLSYVASFAVSMGVEFEFQTDDSVISEYDSSQLALRRTKQERELSKNWGIIKDVIDAGIRSLLTLLRPATTSKWIKAWVPQAPRAATDKYEWGETSLQTLASGFLAFCMREIRIGAGDTRSGYSDMVICPTEGSIEALVDMDKVRLQNWTVAHGLALTAGDLALQLGLYRTAIEAHTLFLAARGQMWRVLLALANELACYFDMLGQQKRADLESREALKIVAKAAVVAAIQATPRSKRLQVADLVVVQHRVIPATWVDQVLDPSYTDWDVFDDEDDLLFGGLLQTLDPQTDESRSILPEEIGIALVKVVFAKKSGLFALHSKFPAYMREYRQRLDNHAHNGDNDTWQADALEAIDEDDTADHGPRSVRTL